MNKKSTFLNENIQFISSSEMNCPKSVFYYSVAWVGQSNLDWNSII